MHEIERHRIILSEVNQRSMISINDLKSLVGSSEATIRRDIVRLDKKGLLTRIRGGAEPIVAPSIGSLLGTPYIFNETVNSEKKLAITKLASEMCKDGDFIIINGGTTTFQMMMSLPKENINVLTNSWTIADYLHRNTTNVVTLPGGSIFKEQNIILCPLHDGISTHYLASKMFMGAQGINAKGILESDPLIMTAEQRLMKQAEKIIVVADSSKFQKSSSMILCPLERIDILITDDGIDADSIKMLEDSGIDLRIAKLEH